MLSKSEVEFSVPFRQIGEYKGVAIMRIGVTRKGGSEIAVVQDCETPEDLPETFDVVSPTMAFRLTRAGW